ICFIGKLGGWGRGILPNQKVFFRVSLGHSPSGKPHSVFDSQSSIVNSISAHRKDDPGLSKRTLDAKFAAANRILKKDI
ncbi:hypothetical protein EKA85_32215, partial [Pseudomonas veronii]